MSSIVTLLKTFAGVNHKHRIAKINACGYSVNAMKLIQDYLSIRSQRKN